jgi:UDP-N-acetylmuramyl tripeptide synthase
MYLRATIFAAQLAGSLSRRFGRGSGDTIPGVVAERLDPTLALKLAQQLPHGAIVVTGTNGKTTTTKLLYEMLVSAGEVVVSNRTGSNLKRGVVSALIGATNRSGKVNGSVGLFEVDEANLRLVTPLVRPHSIVVTNLFRDQLDRYGELDTTATKIGLGIDGIGAKLYLNADDPLVASLAHYVPHEDVTYFGIEGLPSSIATATKTAVDSDRCPVCGDELKFRRTFFGHIGHYRCGRGHFDRPQPSIAITSVEKADAEGSTFTIAIEGRRTTASMPLGGVYNLYNALAAVSVADGIGLPLTESLEALASTTPAFGRVERIAIDGKLEYLLLVKNPVGFTQVIDTFLRPVVGAKILIVINDLAADGRDVSWLWDVPFEVLASQTPQVVVSGIRATDMALRLKYAGIDSEVIASVSDGLNALQALLGAGETGYILPTYTAMLEVRRVLGEFVTLTEAGS